MRDDKERQNKTQRPAPQKHEYGNKYLRKTVQRTQLVFKLI